MANKEKTKKFEAEESLELMDKTYGGYKKDLSPREVAELREKMHSADKKASEKAKNELIRYGYSTICAYAKKLVKDHSKSEEYDKRMDVLLLFFDAVEKYNPDENVKLTTFFTSSVKNKVNDIKSRDGVFTSNPKELRAVANLSRIRKEYRDKYGRLPDHETKQYIFVQEKLAKKSAKDKISLKYIKEKETEARKAIKNSTISTLAVSLEQTINNDDDDDGRVVGDVIADES